MSRYATLYTSSIMSTIATAAPKASNISNHFDYYHRRFDKQRHRQYHAVQNSKGRRNTWSMVARARCRKAKGFFPSVPQQLGVHANKLGARIHVLHCPYASITNYTNLDTQRPNDQLDDTSRRCFHCVQQYNQCSKAHQLMYVALQVARLHPRCP